MLWDAPPDEDLLPPPDRRDRCLIFDGLITFSDVIDDCEENFDDDDGIVVALELSTNRSSSRPAMVYINSCRLCIRAYSPLQSGRRWQVLLCPWATLQGLEATTS